jgi:hypothetical protein
VATPDQTAAYLHAAAHELLGERRCIDFALLALQLQEVEAQRLLLMLGTQLL